MPFITDLAQALNAYRAPGGSKLTVVEVAGWQSRGYAGQGLSGTVGHMWHHTATARSAFAYSDAPTLNMLVNGHSTLPGPLCNIALGRSGTVYVVAAGVANHAGPGSAGGAYVNVGNHYFIGNEMESSGVAPYDWTDDQLRIMPHVGAALEAWYGDTNFIQIGHKEYSSMGKIDPANVDMGAMRNRVNDLLYSGGSAGSPAISTPNEESGDWSAMATREEIKQAAFEGAWEALNKPIKREGGEKGHTSLVTEAAWRTYNDNTMILQLQKIGGRVFHLWNDMRVGVAGRIDDGPVGKLFRAQGYKDEEEKRKKHFLDNEKKGWL